MIEDVLTKDCLDRYLASHRMNKFVGQFVRPVGLKFTHLKKEKYLSMVFSRPQLCAKNQD